MSAAMRSLPRHRTVEDVMTATVHVATASTSFKLLVRLIEENRISAIPIVDQQGVPIGIVSEADLLLKERRSEFESGGAVGRLRHRRERAKAEGLLAADVMTSPPLTIPAGATLLTAAREMQRHNVRRLIVVDDRGRIAGIVTRSDLLQVFLRTDEDLRDEIVEDLLPAVFMPPVDGIEVDVRSNVVTLCGEVDRKSDAEMVTRLAREIDGVVEVINQLSYRWDDTASVAALEGPVGYGPL